MQRFLELFDDNDTKHRSELDVSQTDKCFQCEHHLTLSEDVIKHNCNQTLLQNENKVSRLELSRSTRTSISTSSPT